MDDGFTHDRFTTTAGPYVLGALSPSERAEYEQHLRDCADCRRSVEQLAGLPGLLSRTPPEVVAALAEEDPVAAFREGTGVPDTVLPAVLRTVRRRRTTRRVALTGGLAAAAGLVTALVWGDDDRPTPAPVAAPAPSGTADGTTNSEPTDPEGAITGGAGQSRRMDALMPVALSATVQLNTMAWGTEVDMVCAYADVDAEEPHAYALVLTDADGLTERIGTWTAVPGRDAQLTGVTAWTREKIAAVEVQTLSGTPVLRLAEA